MKKYDAVIIGFGKAGKTLASELAGHGWSVAMIERSDTMYGGTCINIGCIPTKALIHSAGMAAAGHPQTFEQRRDYYRQAVASKTTLVDLLRDKNYHKLADNGRIDVLTGQGGFLSPEVVAVKTAAGTQEVTGKYIFINTGAETALPPIDGIAQSKRVYTSTSIMELEELPRHLVIVGGGYIGLEFASMYASFGSKVTVLEGFAELIPREDRDVAAAVQQVLEKRGIAFRMQAKVGPVHDTAQGVSVTVTDGQTGGNYQITADAVLLATGRRPATEGLNLAAAGVETTERGAIKVDGHLHTTAPRIYAVGDVTGGLQFTYVSLDDYRIVRDELFGRGERTTANRGPVPYSVFIDPPLSHVGMHEEEARKAGLDIRVNTIAVASFPRSRILGSAEGVLKAVIDAKTDLILGCTLFGPESSEVINTVAMAMKHGITAREVSNSIYTHPSMSESLNDLFA
ncbi:FAD-dependent oxidoreductase [uncultured Alistipes sp.]|uniref:FAD-dependent oxidoreductase n=1 Tax=uncultured Alistipes sp. TaxID=538949 RepID=UPI00262457FA|nr:FAD-dependent oxidoreductase [uncultured Alistipes sp.]